MTRDYSNYKGPKHHSWKGDAAGVRTGRARAETIYPVIGPCVECGAPKSERHHVDGNTLNNEISNIKALCRKCHMKADGRLEALAKCVKAQRLWPYCKWGHERDLATATCKICNRRYVLEYRARLVDRVASSVSR